MKHTKLAHETILKLFSKSGVQKVTLYFTDFEIMKNVGLKNLKKYLKRDPKTEQVVESIYLGSENPLTKTDLKKFDNLTRLRILETRLGLFIVMNTTHIT